MLDTRPLRATTFRHLAAAYWTNELGNLVGDVALAILVFDRTNSAVATAVLFVALRFAPAAVAQLLTSRVEAAAARRVLPVLYALEAALFVAMAAVSRDFSLPAILVLAACDGVLAITAKALTRSASANHLMRRDLLREGNAILNLGTMASLALGPAIGGVIVAWQGAGAALLVDAATFVVTALIVATTPRLHIASDTEINAAGRRRAGLEAIRSRPLLVKLFLACGIALMLASIAVPVEVVFAKRTLNAGDTGYGALLAAWGAGMVLGGALFAFSSRFRITLVLGVSAAIIALGYGGLAISPTLAIACAFSVLGGTGNGVAGIAAITAIQQEIPLTAQSAVMAVLEGVNQVMPGIGFIAGGALTAIYSARLAYAVSAIGVGVVILVSAARPLLRVGRPAIGVANVPVGKRSA